MNEVAVAPPAPPTDEEQEELNHRLQIQVVDQSEGVQANAVDQAEESIAEQTRLPEQRAETGWGRFSERVTTTLKSIWYGNIARDYVRQRQIHQNREQIVESRNLYVLSGGTETEHAAAATALVTRFTSDLLHEGETNKDITELDKGEELATRLKDLVREFATGAITADALKEEKTRLLDTLGAALHAKDRSKGLLLADNIVKVAEHAKAAFEHGVGLDRIDQALKIKTGEAIVGARTEARRDAADRILEKIGDKAGVIANETTLAAGVGIIVSAGKFVTRNAARAAAATLGMGVGAGVFGGLRERLRMTQERQTHGREMAENGEIYDNATVGRRGQLEAARYETVSARSLSESLNTSLAALDSNVDTRVLSEAVANLAHAQTRIKLSDQLRADFISFSGKTNVEEQRLELDILVAQLKVKLQDKAADVDEDVLQAAGLTSRDTSETIGGMANWTSEILSAEMSDKDRVFNTLRRNRALKMGAVSFVTGVTVGALIQEGRALVSDDLQGVFEHSSSDHDRRTLLAGVFGRHNVSPHDMVEGDLTQKALNEHTSVNLPPGFELTQAADGHYQLMDNHGKMLVEGIGFDSHGQLDETTRSFLGEHGYTIHDHTEAFTATHTDVSQVSRTTDEYLWTHRDEFSAVHRELWYDNNTPGSFDRNELRLLWGGQGGMDANGNYVFNVSHMLPDGSFHGDSAVNFQEALNRGDLRIALSMTRGSQNFVSMVPIDANGNAVVDAHSYIGQSLFENQAGHAQFNGAYAEVVQLTGTNANGETTMRMLATHVGENSPHSAMDTVTTVVADPHERIISSIVAPESATLPTEIAPVLPIYGRRGLEKLGRARAVSPEFVPGYYQGRSLEELQAWIAEDPTRLRPRRQENGVWVEADGSPVIRSIEREKELIQKFLARLEKDNPTHYEAVKTVAEAMAKMDDNCRVAINVPAWMEGRGLKNFLEQFTNQEDANGEPVDPSLYEVNILVNRKIGTPSDDSVRVIEQFTADFEATHGVKPRVNYYDIELDPPYNNVGYARKLLTDATMMRSVNRANQEGTLYIESEDADIYRADPLTVSNLINKFDANPHLDAVRGVADRVPEYLKENDMLFLRRRIWDFTETLARGKKFRDPTLPGWNEMWNRNWTNGWNSGFTAEAYAMIDGYDPVPAGEDMIIGERISMVRGDGRLPNLEVVGRVSTRSDGSPRRFIAEITREKEAYADGEFTDEALNQELREKSIEELLQTITGVRRITPGNQTEFEALVRGYAGFIKTITPTQTDAAQMTKRLLFWLGFMKDDYTIQNGNLTINSWGNVKSALDGYRERYDAKHPPVVSDISDTSETLEEDSNIGAGSQYKVFNAGEERVRKVPQSSQEMNEAVRKWFKGPEEDIDNYVVRLAEYRTRGADHVHNLASQSPEASALFGHPTFEDDGVITQDKVQPLGEVLTSVPEAEAKRLIDSYVEGIRRSWQYGCFDWVFNLASDAGVNSDGQVVIADFGEMGLNKETMHRIIDTQQWKDSYDVNNRLSPSLRDYFLMVAQQRLTHSALDSLWGERAAQQLPHS